MTLPQAPGVDFAGLSDIGSVREENQDTIRLPEPGLPPERGLLYALADGMGGLAQGKLASSMAVDAMFESIYSGRAPVPRCMGKGVELANSKVVGASMNQGNTRMGTTLTAANLLGDELWIAHVGDSRAYLVRDGSARLLTSDHTAVGDMVRMRLLTPDKVRTHVQRSTLNRAVGLGLFVRPEVVKTRLRSGDAVVICSDGLWSVIEDEEIGQIVSSSAEPETLCAYLIDEAISRGSDDNVSVIAVRLNDALPASGREGSKRGIYASLTGRLSALMRPSTADH
jgi:protein phosphatase